MTAENWNYAVNILNVIIKYEAGEIKADGAGEIEEDQEKLTTSEDGAWWSNILASRYSSGCSLHRTHFRIRFHNNALDFEHQGELEFY